MAAVAIGCEPACAPRSTQFEIVDYADEGPRKYVQAFDDCRYSRDAEGNIEIVVRREGVDEQGQRSLQLIHIRTFWVAKPGATLAERTMTNATVSYLILAGVNGAGFEGSGFVTFSENRAKDALAGELELSSLKPVRRLGSAAQLFQRSELTGKISARRDGGAVVAAVNEMRRLFGPMPEYDLSTGTPDVH